MNTAWQQVEHDNITEHKDVRTVLSARCDSDGDSAHHRTHLLKHGFQVAEWSQRGVYPRHPGPVICPGCVFVAAAAYFGQSASRGSTLSVRIDEGIDPAPIRWSGVSAGC
ncbi:hypothetical protein PoB_005187500 [Plakobranchus ocellatus]|uniref:Uncharacterized protein n=1 Tax=Plakobranchus ocellatus TaxID=259542 RepID=A0AAV4C183_9GAST|nr:hypothetical protein PoB_005187500 [Plakobranchus ocellatus]